MIDCNESDGVTEICGKLDQSNAFLIQIIFKSIYPELLIFILAVPRICIRFVRLPKMNIYTCIYNVHFCKAYENRYKCVWSVMRVINKKIS